MMARYIRAEYTTPDGDTLTLKSPAEAREFAIEWQHGCESVLGSWQDVADWGNLLAEIGDDWGLTDEFRENGLI